MKISERKQGDITILQPHGRLDATNAADMDRSVATLIKGGVTHLVLDLSGLEYVSSAGLRVFLSAAKNMKNAQGKFSLGNPTPQVRQVLEVAGFSTILPVFATMAEAIGTCTAEAVPSEPVDTARKKLTVAEEIYLLALDESQGVTKRHIPTSALDYALASALLMELALCDRVDTELTDDNLTILKVTSAEPTGDTLLDDTLRELQQEPEPKLTSFWLERLTNWRGHIGELVLERLIRKGILKQENKRILWVLEVKRYPLMDDREVKEVRTRLRELILGDDIPDAHDVVLISLGNACRLMDDLFTPKEYSLVEARIDALARLDLIGQEMTRSIREIERAIAIMSMPPM